MPPPPQAPPPSKPATFGDFVIENDDYISNGAFLADFLTGSGATVRCYGPKTNETKDMMRSPGATKIRNAFYAGGGKGFSGGEEGSYGTWQAAWDAGPFAPLHWDQTEFQVGGFGGASAVNNGDGTVTFKIPNEAGSRSFLYHAVPNRTGTIGPLRTITQEFQWTEKIGKSKCGSQP